MREYYQRRALAAGMAQPPRQGELLRQTEAPTQQQRADANIVALSHRNRNVHHLTP
jgi:hypothetical protein